MFFSIVIPLYNKELHIKRAIDSVLQQTVQNFELIIIDDGSTDNSAEIVKSYSDERIRLISQQNAGASVARNKGIEESQSEYIAFLDGDDEWLPEFLSIISTLIEKYPQAGAYATDFKNIGLNNKIIKRKIYGIDTDNWEGLLPNFFQCLALGAYPISSSSICIPKTIFQTIGTFPLNVQRIEDQDMYFRIALKYPIAFSSKKGAIYYRDVENSKRNVYLPTEIPYENLLMEAIEKKQISKTDASYVTDFLADTRYGFALRYLLAHKPKESRKWADKMNSKRLKRIARKYIVLLLSFFPLKLIDFIFSFSNIKNEFHKGETQKNKKRPMTEPHSIKISLLLPTRGRVFLLQRFLDSLVENSYELSSIEVVLCLDNDDTESIAFNDERLNIKKVISEKATMGTYNSKCLEASSGELVMLINDDLVVNTPDWDKHIIDLYLSIEDGIFIAYPDDMEKADLSTFPILSRKTCEILVDPYPKEYQDLFIDDHLFDIFIRLKKLKKDRLFFLKHVVFDHRHFVDNRIRTDVNYSHKKRYRDYITYIELRKMRQVCAERLHAAINKQPMPDLKKEPLTFQKPKNTFDAIWNYSSTFLMDKGLPLGRRLFWFIRFTKYYLAMKKGFKFLVNKTYTLYSSED